MWRVLRAPLWVGASLAGMGVARFSPSVGVGMKARMMFMAGAAIGYVVGTKAGRARYEQTKRLSQQVSENPNVQEAAGRIRAEGGECAGKAGQRRARSPQQVAGRRGSEQEEESPQVY